ncbi:MAG: ABC transporter permease [Acidobacteriia bacterium]|nr:ABC transporter permease [Terriglobia bacterium]
MFWRRKELREQDLERELQSHLELEAEERKDAYAARRALGNLAQIKEEVRATWPLAWLDAAKQDIRYALRVLRQNPGFAAVALLTLALGTGATTVMFSVANGVLLKPLPFAEPDRLVNVYGRTEKYGEQWGFSYLDFLDCRRQSQTLDIAAWTDGGGTIGAPGETEYTGGVRVSSNFFSVLGAPLLRGREFLPEEDRPGAAPVIIISSFLWQRHFGSSPSAIGSSFRFEGKSYTVVGIASSSFELVDQGNGVFTPLGQNWADPRMQNRGSRFLHALARFRPGVAGRVAFNSAQMELDRISRGLAEQFPTSDAGRTFVVRALGPELVKSVRSTLWLLLAAVSLVLLIACTNIGSVLLARAVSRERELAMRAALGAGRGRLVRQCLTESAVLSIAGGTLGVLLAVIGIRPFVTLWPRGLPLSEAVTVDWRVLVFALGISVASGLLFGLAPALRAPASELEQTLRAGVRSIAAGSRRIHAGFVTTEIALAVVLLISAGMLGNTLLRLASLDPGINVHNVLTARVEPPLGASQNPVALRASWQAFLERTRSVPGVESAALSDIIPMRMGENVLGYWTTPELPPIDRLPLALASCVTPDYLEVMGIPLRRGRFFTEQDRLGSTPVVVIDENLARHAFGETDAVGKRLWIRALDTEPVQVIGVVGHVRHWGLAGDDLSRLREQIYYPFAQLPDQIVPLLSSVMSVAVRTRIDPLSVVEPLSRAARGGSGDQVMHDVYSLEQLAGASLARQRFLLLLFAVFAGLALLLACVGIYGVLSYLTSRRVPEIGLRMALGASAGEVLWMILRQSLTMISAGAAAGLLAAILAGRLLQRLVEGMRPAEPSTFALMIAVLLAAALTASFIPARRASKVDPMTALRSE